MSGRTQKLNLYLDDDAKAAIFEIKANANDATFQYTGKALKTDADLRLQYKSGVAYVSVLTQFGTVQNNINTEYTRALAAEGVISTSVNTEKNRSEAAELVLRTDLASEVARATGIDTSFQTALATETASRVSADSKLTTDLSFEVSRAGASETVITGLVSDEKARGLAAELVLRDGLAAELVLRASEDAKELARALAAELVLRTDLATEFFNRIGGAQSNYATLDGYIEAEKVVRAAADNALTARLDFLTINTDAKKLDSLSEIVNRMNSTGVDVYTRLARIEEVLEILRGSSIYSVAQVAFVSDVPASLP